MATKIDMAELRSEIRGLRGEIGTQIERMGRRITMWTGSMVLIVAGIAFAAGRLIPG